MPSLIWINGPFGGGKSSVARALVELLDGSVLFDPEYIGFLLREILPVPTGDFQDLPQWRDLWVRTAATLTDHGSRIVVMPMTVQRRAYVEEVVGGLRRIDARVHHVVLDAMETTLLRRIAEDSVEPEHAREWRTAQLPRFMDARRWLLPAADVIVQTDELSADGVAAEIARLLTYSTPGD